MLNLQCDAGDDDDDALPRPRKCQKADGLTPAPPRGWLRVLTFSSGPDPLAIGCWLCAILTVQELSKSASQRLHAVTRDAYGRRVLVVAPQLRDDTIDMIDEFNSRMQHCSCGGSDCLEGPLQHKALQVFARRAWNRASPAERIDYLTDENDGIALAFAGPDAVFQIEDSWSLMQIAGAV